MKHADILRKAATHLKRVGLAIGDRGHSATEPMCALGVLDFVTSGNPMALNIDSHPILKRLTRALKLSVPFGRWAEATTLADWSNASDTDTVVRAFRRVAEQWDARGR